MVDLEEIDLWHYLVIIPDHMTETIFTLDDGIGEVINLDWCDIVLGEYEVQDRIVEPVIIESDHPVLFDAVDEIPQFYDIVAPETDLEQMLGACLLRLDSHGENVGVGFDIVYVVIHIRTALPHQLTMAKIRSVPDSIRTRATASEYRLLLGTSTLALEAAGRRAVPVD